MLSNNSMGRGDISACPPFRQTMPARSSDGSDGRWGVSTVKRMLKTYQFYETNEKGGGFSSSVLKRFQL